MASANGLPIDAATLFSVPGLNAVITGGGSGLGSMMARAVAVNGANKVFIIGRREESLKKVASSLENNTAIIPIVGDVTSKDSLQSCFDTVKSQVPYIDVLICNSGITGPSCPSTDSNQNPISIEELQKNMWARSAESITQTYAVNVVGVDLTISAFLPLLSAANTNRPTQGSNGSNLKPRPQIITTSSIGGFNRNPFANMTYGATKAALTHLTKQLATVLAPHDIRANVIAPGMYLSEMTQGVYKRQGKEQTHNIEGAFPKEFVPATRTGDESDMAGVILWLTSRAGAYINGCVVVTDGGRLSIMPATY